MAELLIDGGDLVLSLSGWERVGAFHGSIRAPLSAVEDVAATDTPFKELRGQRAPGTGIPRVIALGTWRKSRREKGFAAVYRGKRGVVVRLRDHPFGWLCVSADDPEEIVARIRAAV